MIHFLILPGSIFLILTLTNYAVPNPYLDETFHIPQSVAYCNNYFSSWDPKLTTPAGLYLLSYPIKHVTTCTVNTLRSINAFGIAIVLPILVYRICQQLRLSTTSGGRRNDRKPVQTAMNAALMPLVYFFATLWYTDVFSTIFVLAAYLSFLKQNIWVSAVYCWFSLWFRQTNIVWTGMIAGLYAVDVLERLPMGLTRTEVDSLKLKWLLRKWKMLPVHNPIYSQVTSLQDFYLTPLSVLQKAVGNAHFLFSALTPYLFVFGSFLGFIIWNDNTIVLGDKSAHRFTLNTPQVLYLSAFLLGISWPILVCGNSLRRFMSHLMSIRGTAAFGLFAIVTSLAIQKNTVLHPYLLADNRHYVFYLFHRILLRRPPYTLLFPIPAYYTGLYLVFKALESKVTIAWILFWVAASTISVIGSGLVEFRYFILPWMLWRVQMGPRVGATAWKRDGVVYQVDYQVDLEDWKVAEIVEALWFACINVGTFWMFLMKPFEWIHEPGVVQRFMW